MKAAQASGIFRTTLRNTGKDQKGHCPFHADENPSASINLKKQIWHCFSCHRGGNLAQFYSEVSSVPADIEPVEGVSVTEARASHKKLCKERQLSLPGFSIDNPDSNLFGYAQIPSYDGQVVQYRRMFPGEPRYVTPAGQKKLFWATPEPTRRGDVLWLCEGPLDAYALAAAGARYVASMQGGDLNDKMAYSIRHYHTLICPDADPSGYLAAQRAAEKLSEFKATSTTLELPDGWGKDPSEVWANPKRQDSLSSWIEKKEHRSSARLGREAVLAVLQPSNVKPRIFKSSLPNLDDAIKGWRRGVTNMLQGIPKKGKTSLALQLATDAALQKKGCVYASLEITRLETWARIASRLFQRHEWDQIELDIAKYTTQEEKETLADLGEYLTVVCGQPLLRIMQAVERTDADFLVLDYIQALPGILTEDDGAGQRVGSAMRTLVNWAADCDAGVLVVSSVNRSSYEQGGGLGGGKYSGDLEFAGGTISSLVGDPPHLTWRIDASRRGNSGANIHLNADLGHCLFTPRKARILES